MKRLLLTLLLTTVLTGCHAPNRGERWVRSEIYFGLSTPDGSAISLKEWQAFLDEVVTPRFPAGLTVLDAAGQWRNATAHIDHEPSKVLVLFHKPGAAIETKLDEIRAQYCRQFHQEAVLKVTTKVRVAF